MEPLFERRSAIRNAQPGDLFLRRIGSTVADRRTVVQLQQLQSMPRIKPVTCAERSRNNTEYGVIAATIR